MRNVSVPWTTEAIPVIGYGTSALMGGGRAAAARLLEAAYDAGIRHFDTAAYYGMGEAEGVVGEFLVTKRSRVTVTTKAGIEPPKSTSTKRVAVIAGRRLVRTLPLTKGLFNRTTKRMIRGSAFAPKDIKASLDRSLRALRTDCIDCFLLHDYTLGDGSTDALVDVLQAAAAAGKVKSFGIGAPFLELIRVASHEPRLARVVQFENSVVQRNLDRLSPDPVQFRITHGSISHSFKLIESHLLEDPTRSRRWSESLGYDVANPDTLASLMLDYAVRSNHGGLVLFSSGNLRRIATNARAILETSIDAGVAEAFAAHVADEIRPN